MKTFRAFVLAISLAAASGSYAEEWIAIAATHWRDGGGTPHAAVGYSGIRSSEDDAAASALNACKSGGGVGCEVLGAFDDGCIYITSGSSNDKAGYGAGATPERAMEKCTNEGIACKTPVGGCID